MRVSCARMAFVSERLDRSRLARVAFGDQWCALADPADGVGCDAMSVPIRLGLYRLLIERTNRHGAFGRHDEHNPFWGYASQLAWQQQSGRLGRDDGAIAADSWWGACNHALSVVPYVAAMRLRVVPALDIAVPPRFEPVMAAWRDAFTAMTRATPIDHDGARVAIWRAHLASITLAVNTHRAEYAALPAPERRFARGWVRMVDLFAAAGLRTDLDKLVETGGGALPSRVLRDRATTNALPRHERSTVARVSALADRPSWRWAIERRGWARIMRSRRARDDAEALLIALLAGGQRAWPARGRAVAYATIPRRLLDLGR